MGIQINGQTDSITASDGSLSISGMELSDVTNINASGIGTFNSINATSIVGVSTIGVTTAYVTNINDGPIGTKNIIINGDMRISQRTTSTAGVTATQYGACDRWNWVNNTLGTWTISQETDAPNGFGNSWKALCTTADASPSAGDYAVLYHRIEAQNLQHLAYGTSEAKQMTLSFWVKSNKTGSASVGSLQDDNGFTNFSTSYTINSADTWEYKSIVIPGDTSGIINNDTGQGLNVEFWLNSGSNFNTGTQSAGWEASLNNTTRNASNLGVGGAINDYFQLTGVQLEVGPVASPFERRTFGQELFLCQRYYEKSYDLNVAPGTATYNGMIQVGDAGFTSTNATVRLYAPFRVSKRTPGPTVTWYDSAGNAGKCNLPDTTTNRTITPIYTNNMGAAVEGYSASATTDHRMYIHYVCSDEL